MQLLDLGISLGQWEGRGWAVAREAITWSEYFMRRKVSTEEGFGKLLSLDFLRLMIFYIY